MNYLIIFIVSFVISILATKLIKNYGIKNKIALAQPRTRDVHKKPVSRIGGVAVFISFWLVVLGVLIIKPGSFTFIKEQIAGIDKNLLGLFMTSLLWLVVGLYDDIRGTKAWVKLLTQIICGVLIVSFGIKIWWISNPFGGLNIVLGGWTYLLVPVWIVLLMNVINWFDGIDGLAPSISIITLVVLFLLAIDPAVNQSATALLCVILAGVLVGFLPSNWNPAKIFLGDSGSGFLGLMLATFAIISGAKLATAFLVLGIPILDALIVIFGRVKHKKSIFSADKSHLHHRFLQAGFSVKQTVIFLSIISLLFGIIALKSQTQEKFQAILWLVVLMGIILLSLSLIKKYKKINERKK